MIRLEWNALRVGDHVLVHDPRDAEARLLPGVVVDVDPLEGSHDLGIRVKAEREAAVVIRPKRLVVHQDPRDPSERCWRCDAIALTRRAG
jgi:hypothetical protein